MHEIVMCCV